MIALALVWFFFLGGMGFSLPFFTLYLKEWAGLGGAQVGAVVAMIPAMGLLVQGLWGQLSDRSGARRQVLALVCFGAALGQGALLLQRDFAGFLLAMAATASFQSAVVPLAMASSLAILQDGGGAGALGRVRVWGTVGFAIFVLGFPVAIAWLGGALPPGAVTHAPGGVEAGLPWIFVGAGVCMALAGLCACFLPDVRALGVRAERGDWRELLRLTDYRRVLAFQFVAYLSLQGPMHLFPILVKSRGGGVAAISEMWAWMLVLEVPLVLAFGWTIARFGVRGVIVGGMLAAAVRWTVSGWVEDLDWVTVAQLGHGITVWGVMMGFPVYVDAVVPERLRSTAHGVSAVVGLSLASIVSNLGAGLLVEWSGPMAPARVGGVVAAVAAVAMLFALPEPRRHAEAGGTGA